MRSERKMKRVQENVEKCEKVEFRPFSNSLKSISSRHFFFFLFISTFHNRFLLMIKNIIFEKLIINKKDHQ
jgi:hypothetical protein